MKSTRPRGPTASNGSSSPGEMEWERHARAMKEGIPLPPDVVASLKEAGALVDLDFDKAIACPAP